MFPQRSLFRAAAQLRSPAVRSAFQRRSASTGSSGLHGAEDNAFNRERLAVKEHAAATSGEYKSLLRLWGCGIVTDVDAVRPLA